MNIISLRNPRISFANRRRNENNYSRIIATIVFVALAQSSVFATWNLHPIWWKSTTGKFMAHVASFYIVLQSLLPIFTLKTVEVLLVYLWSTILWPCPECQCLVRRFNPPFPPSLKPPLLTCNWESVLDNVDTLTLQYRLQILSWMVKHPTPPPFW